MWWGCTVYIIKIQMTNVPGYLYRVLDEMKIFTFCWVFARNTPRLPPSRIFKKNCSCSALDSFDHITHATCHQNATANTNWPELLRILSRTTVPQQWSSCVHWKNWDQTLVVLWKRISQRMLAERNSGQRWVVGGPRQTSRQQPMPVVQCPHRLVSKDGQNN